MTRGGVHGSADFKFSPADVELPTGAFAGGRRRVLRHRGRPVVAFSDGAFRPYLHPVWTPAGAVVTAEKPADHPHHCGIWCAADHVGLMMQGPDGIERYDYNFYVDDIFQGRAPGRLITTQIGFEATGANTGGCTQAIEWRGPREWAAPEGRLVLTEKRQTFVTLAETATVIDIVSCIRAAAVGVEIGPTRHAYFNARLSDSIALDQGSQPVDDRRHVGGKAIGAMGAKRVSFAGPVGHGNVAGLAILPIPAASAEWFVADWGVVTVGSMRRSPLVIGPRKSARLACRFVAFDGPLVAGTFKGLPPVPELKEPIP